jgi:chromosome segregation ATPase
MKNPFRKTPMQQLETTIASLRKRGEQLAAKRVTAQDALDEAIKTRQQALLSGDLDDQRALDKLQAAVDTGTSALAGIDDAISVLALQKAEAESQLAAERERIARAKAAEKLSAQIATIEAALPNYLEQSRVFSHALSEIGHHHFESAQMAQFVQNAAAQVELASNFVLVELRAMPERIKTGDAPIPREPDAEPVAVVEPPPPTQTVWMLGARNSVTMQAWCGTSGNLTTPRCRWKPRSAPCIAALRRW